MVAKLVYVLWFYVALFLLVIVCGTCFVKVKRYLQKYTIRKGKAYFPNIHGKVKTMLMLPYFQLINISEDLALNTTAIIIMSVLSVFCIGLRIVVLILPVPDVLLLYTMFVFLFGVIMNQVLYTYVVYNILKLAEAGLFLKILSFVFPQIALYSATQKFCYSVQKMSDSEITGGVKQ